MSLVLCTDDAEHAETLKARANEYLKKPWHLRDRGFDLEVFASDPMAVDRFTVKEARLSTRVCAKLIVNGRAVGYDFRPRSSFRQNYGWIGSHVGTIDAAYSVPLGFDTVCIRTTQDGRPSIPYTDMHGSRVCQIVACSGEPYSIIAVFGPEDLKDWTTTLETLGMAENTRGGFGSTGK